MRTIKDSWFIVCSDFRGDKLIVLGTFVTTIIFMGYLAGMTSLVTNDVLADQDRTMIADFYFSHSCRYSESHSPVVL